MESKTIKTNTQFFESRNISKYIVPITRNRETTLCRFTNYIPYNRPKYISIEKWSSAYLKYIIDIMNIIKYNICNSTLYKIIEWDSQVIFNNLIRLLYHCSSKYILPNYLLDNQNYTNDSDSDSDS